MKSMKTLTINGQTYRVDDADSVSYDEQQNLTPEQQKKVRDDIGAADQTIISQGRSAKYSISSGGWKRILNIIRGTSGTVNMCLGCNYPFRSMQVLSFDLSGYVKYPDQKDGTRGDTKAPHPILIKRYENKFGVAGTEVCPQAAITQVRICYPASGTSFPERPEDDYEHNPVNCYVEVYIDVDESKIMEGSALPEINMNFAGFANSHYCEAITEETNATGYGIYGEKLTTWTRSLSSMNLYGTRENAIFRDAINRDGLYPHYGLTFTGGGSGDDLRILPATEQQIEGASETCYNPITPGNVKYAVEKYTKDISDKVSFMMESTVTWEHIQKAVSEGKAKEIFPVGTQFVVKNSLVGDFLYDVVAYDHFKSVDNADAHTMTLLCHDIVPLAGVPFDFSEYFYSNGTGAKLPKGSYSFYMPVNYFSWKKGYYVTHISSDVASGYLFVCRDNGMETADRSVSIDSHTLVGSNFNDDGLEYYPIYGPYETIEDIQAELAGEAITYTGHLGTLGSMTSEDNNLNHYHRIIKGSNNYKSSVIREAILHSTQGELVDNQSKFDFPHFPDIGGSFVDSFDPDFLAVVGKVNVPCVNSGCYEPYGVTRNGAYTLQDTFFLPSIKEITGSSGFSADSSKQLEYFKNTSNVDRVKYLNGVATAWDTRTPGPSSNAYTIAAITNGGASSNLDGSPRGVVPMVNIVG